MAGSYAARAGEKVRYDQRWVDRILDMQGLAQADLKDAEMNLRALELKREALLSRSNELERILAEIHNKREQSLRIQKPDCWAMAREYGGGL